MSIADGPGSGSSAAFWTREFVEETRLLARTITWAAGEDGRSLDEVLVDDTGPVSVPLHLLRKLAANAAPERPSPPGS